MAGYQNATAPAGKFPSLKVVKRIKKKPAFNQTETKIRKIVLPRKKDLLNLAGGDLDSDRDFNENLPNLSKTVQLYNKKMTKATALYDSTQTDNI